jgi:hypothetical protein
MCDCEICIGTGESYVVSVKIFFNNYYCDKNKDNEIVADSSEDCSEYSNSPKIDHMSEC